MRLRASHLFLVLLTAGTIAPAAADPAPTFPIDLPAIAGRICDPQLLSPRGSMAQCHVIVRNGGWPPQTSGMKAGLLHIESAEPLMTTCGPWDATMTFTPVGVQPISPNAKGQKGARHEKLTMNLEVRTSLHLANRATGQTADFMLRRGASPAEPWLFEPTSEADRSDDQVLTFDGCIPDWVYKDSNLEVVKEEECPVCPADDDTSDSQQR
jgi:hypothetical protein